jgi:VanZ family protein
MQQTNCRSGYATAVAQIRQGLTPMPKNPNSGLREKPKNTLRIIAAIAAVLLAVAIFIVSGIPSDSLPKGPSFLTTVAHFCEYLLLAILLTVAINAPKRALWITAVIALVLASLYGVSDEVHQMFVPGRNPDPLDWLTDTLGALVGAIATIWFISARKVKRSRQRDTKTLR